jgi:hypothetical protein
MPCTNDVFIMYVYLRYRGDFVNDSPEYRQLLDELGFIWKSRSKEGDSDSSMSESSVISESDADSSTSSNSYSNCSDISSVKDVQVSGVDYDPSVTLPTSRSTKMSPPPSQLALAPAIAATTASATVLSAANPANKKAPKSKSTPKSESTKSEHQSQSKSNSNSTLII